MPAILPILPFLLLLSACGREAEMHQRPELDVFFSRAGVEGAVLLYSEAGGYIANDTGKIKLGHLPASTFKIPNTLISLETGVIDTGTVIRWDGQERWNADWNRDHTLRTAFRSSCVPCYQQLAHRVGVERMRDYVERMDYGRMDIDTNSLSNFWLLGDSRISLVEQMDMLRRLQRDQLPFSRANMAFLKDIMILERKDDHVLRGKTGWTVAGQRNIGWFVGWVDHKGDPTFFVLQIEAPEGQPDFGPKRIGLTKEILREAGAWP